MSIENELKQTLKISHQKKTLARAQAMFCKGLKEAGGDETKVKAFYGSLQVSFPAEVGPQEQRQLAATYTREGEGHANEGWQIDKDMVSKICADFDDILFETVVEVCLLLSRHEQGAAQRPGWCLAADFS